MEHSSNSAEGDNYDDTHNDCTRDKCLYNPKEKATLSGTANKCIANFCVVCGVNMGDCNPRQYCYKLYCPFENADDTANDAVD
jgi:hypothetical protein